MPQAFYILTGAALTAGASWAAGRLLFTRLGLALRRGEAWPLEFLVGSACLSALVFLLSVCSLARKGVFLAAAVLLLAACRRWGARPAEDLPPLPRAWKWFTLAVAVPYAVFYFVNAMAPEMSPDGVTYHLGLVNRYYREHGFVRITDNIYASLSQGMEMLFLFAWAFGRNSAAALVHFTCLVALPCLMIAWGRRYGLAAPACTGAILFFASPVAGVDGASAYNDVAVAAVVFAAFYLLQLWEGDGDRRWLVAAGLLAGFAYAIKYTAFLAVPAVPCYALWKRRDWRGAALALGCAGILIAPWMIKNWILVENPLAPFFNHWFPNPYVHIAFEQDYRKWMRFYPGLTSYQDIPREVTARGLVLNGFLGPVFLLAPLSVGALGTRNGRRLLAAALLMSATYFSNIGTRFLLPAIPFLALALALAMAGPRWMLPVVAAGHAVLSWPAISKLYAHPSAWRLVEWPWQAALRWMPEEQFLHERCPPYGVARLLERSTPVDAVVFAPSPAAEAYTSRRVIAGYTSAEGNLLRDLLWAGVVPDFQPRYRGDFRIPARPLRKVRVVQTARHPTDQWTIAEMHVTRDGRELPRQGSWRVRAQPNPWQAPLAFDNNPATRWLPQQPLEPGMFLELDFGAPLRVDGVRILRSREFAAVRLRLEGEDSQGRLIPLSAEWEEIELPPPPGLRRWAVQEMRARGVTHVLLADSDIGYPEVSAEPAAWGLELAGEHGGSRLFRITLP